MSAILALVMAFGVGMPLLSPGASYADGSDAHPKKFTVKAHSESTSQIVRCFNGIRAGNNTMHMAGNEVAWCAQDGSRHFPDGQTITMKDAESSGVVSSKCATDMALAWYYIYVLDQFRTPAGNKLANDAQRWGAMQGAVWYYMHKYHGTTYNDTRYETPSGTDLTGSNKAEAGSNTPYGKLKQWVIDNRKNYEGGCWASETSNQYQNVVMSFWCEPATLKIQMKKVAESTYRAAVSGNDAYSLKGARYGVYETYAKAKAANDAADDADTRAEAIDAAEDTAVGKRIYSTDVNGEFETKSAFEPGKTYYVAEVWPSTGYALSKQIVSFTAKDAYEDTDHVELVEKIEKAGIKIVKSSSNTGLTDGNACYGLAGAVYGVYDAEDKAKSHSSTSALLTATTNAAGTAETGEVLVAGKTYWVAEITPPKGYALDEAIYEAAPKPGAVATVRSGETPAYCTIGTVLNKIDLHTGAQAQGGASLAGAEFTVRYYDGFYASAAELPEKAARTWVLATDGAGRIDFQDPKKASGGDFYKHDGKNVLPMGTVTVQETKASPGYTLETPAGAPTLFIAQVQQVEQGSETARLVPMNFDGADVGESNPAVRGTEVVQRGDYQLVKTCNTDIDTESPQDGGQVTVAGIRFQIINDNDQPVLSPEDGTTLVEKGGVVCTIVTDSEGFASTNDEKYKGERPNGWTLPDGWVSQGALAYGSYIVHEVIPDNVAEAFLEQHGTKPVATDDWRIAVNAEGQYDPAMLVNNKVVQTPLKIAKVDSETGKQVPLATSFQLFDSRGNLVTHTAHYPEQTTMDTWTTNEAGEVMLPMLLTYGTYTIRETQAPEGYVLSPDGVEFTVDEGYRSWNDPVTVQFADAPQKGRIKITKTDASDEEKAVAGATYVVEATEDITTPEGTVRMEKGAQLTVKTGEDGTAQSEELYLGAYKVYEAKSPEGYGLDVTEHEVAISYAGQEAEIALAEMPLADSPSTIEVLKLDAESGKPLAGAKFRIWQDSDLPADAIPGADEGDDGAKDDGEASVGEAGVAQAASDGAAETWAGHGEYYAGAISAALGNGSFGDYSTMGESDLAELAGKLDAGTGAGDVPFAATTVANETETTMNLIATVSADGKATVRGSDTGTELFTVDAPKVTEPADEDDNAGANGNYDQPGGLTRDRSALDPGDGIGNIVETGDDGRASLAYLAHGDYHILEIEAPEGHYLGADATVHDFSVNEQGLVGESGATFAPVYTLCLSNPPASIGTTLAADAGKSYVAPEQKVALTDTVAYKGAIPGKEYTVSGTLHVKQTDAEGNAVDAGPALDVSGKEITAQVKFTPEEKEGAVEVVFEFDATQLAGAKLVAFEEMREGDALFAVHQDIEDRDQTVDVSPEIGTELVNTSTGNHVMHLASSVTLVDTVSYKGVVPGVEHTAYGVLVNPDTRVPLTDSEGKQISAQAKFTPTESSGNVEVAFQLDAAALAKSESGLEHAVAYETLYEGDRVIATHADPQNKSQTVSVPKIATTATDENGNSELTASKTAKVVDTVFYEGLTPGQDYTVVGTMHLADIASDGTRTDAGALKGSDGKAVTAQADFTPESESGSVSVTFEFDASALAGHSTVAFEKLVQAQAEGAKSKKTTVATHADINDSQQTVAFVEGTPKPSSKPGTPTTTSSTPKTTTTDGSTFAKTGQAIALALGIAALLAAVGSGIWVLQGHRRRAQDGQALVIPRGNIRR